MTMLAIDKLHGDGVSTMCLIGCATGIAESGMTTKGNKLVSTAVRTDVKRASKVRITATDSL